MVTSWWIRAAKFNHCMFFDEHDKNYNKAEKPMYRHTSAHTRRITKKSELHTAKECSGGNLHWLWNQRKRRGGGQGIFPTQHIYSTHKYNICMHSNPNSILKTQVHVHTQTQTHTQTLKHRYMYTHQQKCKHTHTHTHKHTHNHKSNPYNPYLSTVTGWIAIYNLTAS